MSLFLYIILFFPLFATFLLFQKKTRAKEVTLKNTSTICKNKFIEIGKHNKLTIEKQNFNLNYIVYRLVVLKKWYLEWKNFVNIAWITIFILIIKLKSQQTLTIIKINRNKKNESLKKSLKNAVSLFGYKKYGRTRERGDYIVDNVLKLRTTYNSLFICCFK